MLGYVKRARNPHTGSQTGCEVEYLGPPIRDGQVARCRIRRAAAEEEAARHRMHRPAACAEHAVGYHADVQLQAPAHAEVTLVLVSVVVGAPHLHAEPVGPAGSVSAQL